MVAFGQPFAAALVLSVIMLALYVPLGYYVDLFFYKRRRAQQRQAKQSKS